MNRECDICHTPITGDQRRQYCSDNCKQRAYQRRRRDGIQQEGFRRQCVGCSATFYGFAKQPYCSVECRQRNVMPSQLACEYCQSPIEGKTTKRFCGNTCRVMAKRVRDAAGGNNKDVPATCSICAKDFRGLVGKKYCSPTCRDRAWKDHGLRAYHTRLKLDPAWVAARNQKRREYQRKQRLAAFAAYGGHRCACCGEQRYEFLGIDHINGGGGQHRKSFAGKTTIYPWLARNGYPPGFQVLCHNCNQAKGSYGVCPHERERE